VTGRTKAEVRDRTGLPASDRACPYSRRRGEGPDLRLTRRLPGGRWPSRLRPRSART